MKKIYRLGLLGIGLFSLIILALVVGKRWIVEKSNSKVEITIDYSEIKKLARQSLIKDESEKTADWWLREFKEMGATSVALFEDSIQSLINDNRDITAEFCKKIINNNYGNDNELINKLKSYKLDQYDVLISIGEKELFNRIADTYDKYFSDLVIDKFTIDDRDYIILNGTEATEARYRDKVAVNVEGKVIYMEREPYLGEIVLLGVGFDSKIVDSIKNNELEAIPRVNVFLQKKYNKLEIYKDLIKKYNLNPSYFIAADSEVMGFSNIPELATFIQENNINVGLVESNVQRENISSKGLEPLINQLNKENLVRVFTTWDYIQERYKAFGYNGPQEITNTYYRAITERNIRVILFRPFIYDKVYVTDVEAYKHMFNDLETRLQKHGLSYGVSESYDKLDVSYVKKVLITFGILIASLILFELILKINYKYLIFMLAIGLLGILGIYYKAPNGSIKLFAFITAIIFPSLSLKLLDNFLASRAKQDRKNLLSMLGEGALITAICSLVSIIGGIFLFGLMADNSYLVELNIFRGVKLSQILPIAVALFYVITRILNVDKEDTILGKINIYKDGLTKLLKADIKVVYTLILTVVGVVGYIYIARTGHETNVEPSTFEILMRNFFENLLLARPRSKEMFFAIPALTASVYIANRYKYKIASIFLIIASIGQASILNTFCHQRTPLYLSIVRTIYSNIIGIIIGIVIVIVFEAVIINYKKVFTKGKGM